MEPQPPRLAVRETAVALAIEYGSIVRDPVRRDSEEYRQILEKKQLFITYCHEHNIDSIMLSKLVHSIPGECYGPTFPERPFIHEVPDIVPAVPDLARAAEVATAA